MQGIDELGEIPVMQDGRQEPRLTDVAVLKQGTMPGLIETLQRPARGEPDRECSWNDAGPSGAS